MLIIESKYFHLWLLYSLSDLLLFSKRRQESELTGEFYRLRGSGLDVKEQLETFMENQCVPCSEPGTFRRHYT